MSGMAMKFTSLAQIEANQFVSADEGYAWEKLRISKQACRYLHGKNRSAGRTISARRTQSHYRVYQLDTAGHILAGHSIVCRSDAEAMDAACRFAEQAAAVEVWESARRVGCLRQRQ